MKMVSLKDPYFLLYSRDRYLNHSFLALIPTPKYRLYAV